MARPGTVGHGVGPAWCGKGRFGGSKLESMKEDIMSERSFDKFVKRLREADLLQEIDKRIGATHVSLRDLYEGPGHAPSVRQARKNVYAWLMKKGKGNNEIARLFDRAPSGIGKLLGGE